MGISKSSVQKSKNSDTASLFKQFLGSIWIFPVVATLVLITLVAFKINGSSIGAYDTYFYGIGKQDQSLIAGRARDIRSDEWMTNTQMTIAQENNDFARINKNIGNGQDMSVVLDVPYAEWSQLLRPHNLSFFVLPFDYAFALKWWLLSYLLVLSCYFFVLTILPGKRLLAAGIALTLLFSAIVQWWYQYITLGPLYYSLFAATIIIKIVRSTKPLHILLWSTLLAYVVACFALVLYPPFQIAAGVALGFFVAGYLIQSLPKLPRRELFSKLAALASSLVAAIAIVLLFVYTRASVIHSINDTIYPGARMVTSGGFDIVHTFSGFLGFEFLFASKAGLYHLGDGGLLNQSEASNYILLLPFLLLPSLYIMFLDYRRKRAADWPLIAVNACFLLYLAWMFIPHLGIFGKLFFLTEVPMTRLLLGMGLVNILQLILVIRRLQNTSSPLLNNRNTAIIYAGMVWLFELVVGLAVERRAPGFVSIPLLVAFTLPVPLAIYALLRKKYTYAVACILALSVITAAAVNPLYRGTALVTQTPLSNAIKQIARDDDGAWVTDSNYLENFPALNGAHSYSGLYTYPQFGIWKPVKNSSDQDIYNRYAHVTFTFDRDPGAQIATELNLTGVDHFTLLTEPCSQYMHAENIHFILTDEAINDPCLRLTKTIAYPARTFLIYKIN